jgi:hypothetical protein
MTKQYSTIELVLLFLSLGVGVAASVTVFDIVLISPTHEGSHLLGCLIFGIKPLRLTWTGIDFIPVSDWRQNVVGSMGGLSAALFLYSIYVFLDPLFSVLKTLAAHRPRFSEIISAFSILAKLVVVTDIMVQITGGILEGSSLLIYHKVFGHMVFGSVITWGFSCLSIFWLSRKESW